MEQAQLVALIPAGIMLSAGLGVLIAGLTQHSPADFTGRLVGGVAFLGFALTFLILWLRRLDTPTAWAIYPAAVLAFLGLVALVGGQNAVNYTWPLALIVGGGLLLYNNWRKKSV